MTRRQEERLTPACRQFLRTLADHVDMRRAGRDVPHAATCAGCAEHLRAALLSARLLANKPPLPVALRSPQLLAVLCERVSEQSPVANLLAEHLRRAELPADQPWPEIAPMPVVGRQLADAPATAPAWLWSRVQAEVHGAIAGRLAQRRRRRLRLALAAGLLLAGLAAVLPLRSSVTLEEPQIVFERMASPLASDYSPALVLQSGGR